MLRLLVFFILAVFARAEEIPFRNIVTLAPNAGVYWTVVTTGLTGPLSSVTAPSWMFHPMPERQSLWVGDGAGAMALTAGMQSGAAHAVSAAIGAPRAYTTPPGGGAIGPASTIETEWVTTDGSRQRVTTPCFSHNTAAQCAAAHLEMVRAMMALFPPRP